MNKIEGDKPTLMGPASHPAVSSPFPPGTGAAEPQPTELPEMTNRGAGTVVTEDAATAVGPGIKPSNQPMPSDGSDSPTGTNQHPEGTGAAMVQPTSVAANFVPGAGSPTQNRRPPDGGVPVTRPLATTPK